MKSIKVIIIFLFVFCSTHKAQNNLAGTDLKFQTTDSIFDNPYIDLDEWRDNPVRHRYIHGGFEGNGTYFPTLRIAAQRFYYEGTPFGRLENLDRVRVVVK
ncbi:MAG: hypothetical protein JXR67_02800 [Bacteroidales bacterium]|nr:hypothetical protein [Bacteroidales bacterium]